MKLIGYRRNSRKRRSPDRTRAHVVDSSGRCPRLAAVAREISVEIHDPSAYLLPSDGPPRVKSTAKMILPDLACGWGVSAAWQSVVACRWNVSSVGSVQTVPKRRQRRIMIHDGGGGGGRRSNGLWDEVKREVGPSQDVANFDQGCMPLANMEVAIGKAELLIPLQCPIGFWQGPVA